MYDDDDLNDDIALILLKTAIESELDFQVRLPLQGEYFATGTPAILLGKSFVNLLEQSETLNFCCHRMGLKCNWRGNYDDTTASRFANFQQLRLCRSAQPRMVRF